MPWFVRCFIRNQVLVNVSSAPTKTTRLFFSSIFLQVVFSLFLTILRTPASVSSVPFSHSHPRSKPFQSNPPSRFASLAGDASWPKAIDALDTSAPSSSWVRMTMINYCAPIYATELAVVHSKKKGNKLVVVNVASVAGLIPQKEPIYASGKAGLIHFSRCLGYLAPQVRVNNVLPNAAPTPLFLSGTDKEFLEMMKSNMVSPIQRNSNNPY